MKNYVVVRPWKDSGGILFLRVIAGPFLEIEMADRFLGAKEKNVQIVEVDLEEPPPRGK